MDTQAVLSYAVKPGGMWSTRGTGTWYTQVCLLGTVAGFLSFLNVHQMTSSPTLPLSTPAKEGRGTH